MQPLAMILALAENGALGLRGALPWSCPEDREYFLRVTAGHSVIMGRRTFEDTGAELASCRVIVVTRQPPSALSRSVIGDRPVELVPTLDDAIERARSTDTTPFVLGGSEIYRAALPKVTEVYLTRIPGSPEADVFYEPDLSAFSLVSERVGGEGVRFLRYARR